MCPSSDQCITLLFNATNVRIYPIDRCAHGRKDLADYKRVSGDGDGGPLCRHITSMEECAEAAGEATAESGGHYGCRYSQVIFDLFSTEKDHRS